MCPPPGPAGVDDQRASPAYALRGPGIAALMLSRVGALAPNLVANAPTSTTPDRPPKGYDAQPAGVRHRGPHALTRAGELAGSRTAGSPASRPTSRYRGVLQQRRSPAGLPDSSSWRSSPDLAAADRQLPGPGRPCSVAPRAGRTSDEPSPAGAAGSPPVSATTTATCSTWWTRSRRPGDVLRREKGGPGSRPRSQVGRVMAVYGGAVAWRAVIHSDGTPAAVSCLQHYLVEGHAAPARPARPSGWTRRARWAMGPTGPLGTMGPPADLGPCSPAARRTGLAETRWVFAGPAAKCSPTSAGMRY